MPRSIFTRDSLVSGTPRSWICRTSSVCPMPFSRRMRRMFSPMGMVGGMVAVGICFAMQTEAKQPAEIFTMLGTFVVVFLVVQFGMYRMGKRRQEKLEKE